LVTERKQSYPSDSSEEQWALIEPLLPAVNKGGRPEKHPRRAIVDGILYVVPGGRSTPSPVESPAADPPPANNGAHSRRSVDLLKHALSSAPISLFNRPETSSVMISPSDGVNVT
jgi:hypothetical protein